MITELFSKDKNKCGRQDYATWYIDDSEPPANCHYLHVYYFIQISEYLYFEPIETNVLLLNLNVNQISPFTAQ